MRYASLSIFSQFSRLVHRSCDTIESSKTGVKLAPASAAFASHGSALTIVYSSDFFQYLPTLVSAARRFKGHFTYNVTLIIAVVGIMGA